ncbi:MAG: hypothetical protein IT581_22355 [Verrucomicrobiales bacterium]|nr:hypothetical protein [Verrucomicrobiales bacterium]
MNLIEIERLARRLEECLQHPQAGPQEAALAEEYAEACRTVNRRLLQCASMINAGDPHQALQLAEVPPPLLDLVTQLSFKRCEEWRTRCQNLRLPVAEALDGKSIRLLNATYNQGIRPDDPLYREYRVAMMQGDEAKALEHLEHILRTNPGDKNAALEKQRLLWKGMDGWLRGLREVVDAGNVKAVATLVKQAKDKGLSVPPTQETWRMAHALLCRRDIAKLRQFRQDDDWDGALELVSTIRAVCREFTIEINPDRLAEVDEAERWARHQVATVERGKESQKLQRELLALLERHEEDREDEMPYPGAEKARRVDALWRRLSGVALTIPEEVRESHGRFVEEMNARRGAKRARNRRQFVALITLIIATLLVLGGIGLRWRSERLASVELRDLMQSDAGGELESRALVWRNRWMINSDLKDTLRAAEKRLGEKGSILARCRQSLEELEAASKAGFTTENVERSHALIDSLHSDILELDGPSKSGMESRLRAVEGSWTKFLKTERGRRTAEFPAILRQFETAASAAIAGEDAGQATKNRESADEWGEKLRALTESKIPELRLEDAAMSAAESTLKAWDSWRKVEVASKEASELRPYVEALQVLGTNRLASRAMQESAKRAASVAPSLEEFKLALAGLLGPQWPRLPATDDSLKLRPESMNSREKNRYIALREDPNIQNLLLYRLTTLESGLAEREIETHTVYAKGPIRKEVRPTTKFFGQIYDPKTTPTNFAWRELSNHVSKIKMSDSEGNTIESKVYEAVGLKGLLVPKTERYQLELLDVLDRLNRSNEGSPLFRAYLSLKVHELIELRPEEWGKSWAPSASSDRDRLALLGARDIRSGEWYVPSIAERLERPISEFFEKARETSYVRQARFCHALARRLAETKTTFVGHAGGPGLASNLDAGGTGDIWGWNESQRPTVLFRFDGGRQLEGVPTALAYSPLFKLDGDLQRILSLACADAQIPTDDPVVTFSPLSQNR